MKTNRWAHIYIYSFRNPIGTDKGGLPQSRLDGRRPHFWAPTLAPAWQKIKIQYFLTLKVTPNAFKVTQNAFKVTPHALKVTQNALKVVQTRFWLSVQWDFSRNIYIKSKKKHRIVVYFGISSAFFSIKLLMKIWHLFSVNHFECLRS